jgi:hypothetical protein
MNNNSSKTIVEKLKLDKYQNRLILNLPDDVDDFDGLEYDSSIIKAKYDLVFIFVFELEQFTQGLREMVEKKLVSDQGYVFFAYPKKHNPKYDTYINRDDLYNDNHYNKEGYVHGSKLKFARMVSLNDVFTVVGLKNEGKTAKKRNSKPSQSVDDYVDRINDLKQFFQNNSAVLAIYNELTPGYQKDWARYVYSAKRTETQLKRLNEMERVLLEGYKTMDLYRLSKR